MKKTLFFLLSLTCFNLLYGQFGPTNIISKGYEPDDMKMGDLDGDGNDDIFMVSATENLVWHQSRGKGKFAPAQTLATYEEEFSAPMQAVWGLDLDGDKDLDLLTYAKDKAYYFENKGLASFKAMVEIENIRTGNEIASINPTDIDKDGDIDLVVAFKASRGNTLGWLENDGTGQFSSLTVVGTMRMNGFGALTGDLDGDGDMDIFTSSGSGYFGWSDTIVWFENQGGSFTLNDKKTLTTDAVALSEIIDFDGDGDMDILGKRATEKYETVWLENTSAGFKTRSLYYGYEAIVDWKAADLDGDGDRDIVAHFWNILVWQENKGGVFSLPDTLSTGVGRHQIYLADIDGDLDLDLLASSETETAWYENNSSGPFGVETIIERYEGAPVSIGMMNIDNDKDLDLIVGYENHLAWRENKGKGRFGPDQIISDDFSRGLNSSASSNLYAVDLDGDGDMDVLSTNDDNGRVAWYPNLGKGNFGPLQILDNHNDRGTSGLYAHAVDIDNDGDVDILWDYAGGNGYLLHWNENIGNGKFDAPKTLLTQTYSFVEVADLDNDGDMDLVTEIRIPPSENGFGFRWHINDGKGNFSIKNETHDGLGGKPTSRIITIDADGDGDIDVLEMSKSRSSSDRMFFHENLGGGNFGKAVGFETPHGSVLWDATFQVLDLDNDNDLDIIQEDGLLWWENLGDNTFRVRFLEGLNEIRSTSHRHYDFSPIDIDKDGDLDFVFTLRKSRKLVWTESFFGSKKYLKGNLFYDVNENGIQDSGEKGLKFMKTEVQPGSLSSYTNSLGEYAHEVDNGVHTVAPQNNSDWKITGDSASYTRTHSKKKQSIEGLDFGFTPKTIRSDITPRLTSARARCNRRIPIWSRVVNRGTTIGSGILQLTLDDSLEFDTSIVTPDSIIGQNIYWHYDSIFFSEVLVFTVYAKVPAANGVDDDLESILTLSELDSNGKVVKIKTISLRDSVVCAFDPNDKNVSPKGDGFLGLVAPDEELSYLVRFQNTGNDTAFTVMVRDQLDADLDWSTLEPVASSHPMEVTIGEDGEVVFTFKDILLPDSNVNELESHGFVEYTIKPKKDLQPLTRITGPAHIYFDFNLPIVTNNVLTTIVCYSAPQPAITFDFPDLNAGVEGDYTFVWYLNDEVIENETSATLMPLEEGSYSVEVMDTNTCTKRSEAFDYKADGIGESNRVEAAVYPNPFSESATILFDRDLEGNHDLVIYNLVGAEVTRFNNLSGRQMTLNKQDIGSGMFLPYLVNTQSGERVFIEKLMVR